MPTVIPNKEIPTIPVAVAPPKTVEPQKPRPSCVVDRDKDGTLVVTFTISPAAASKFVRQACGRRMEDFLWETRGLRHFENQAIG